MTSLFHGLIVCKTKLLYVQLAFAWVFFGGFGLMNGLSQDVAAVQGVEPVQNVLECGGWARDNRNAFSG